MKKIIVISDSFKGSVTSSGIAAIAKDCIPQYFPACQVVGLPVADGGEGTVDCFLEAIGGQRIIVPVTGPWDESAEGFYARIGDTAVVEMAAAAGLPMVGDRLDPSRTTTWGVGLLIRHAIEQGAKEIILGLGGSATNDGGCGCAAALGVRFLDENGREFRPVGATLKDIAAIDCTEAEALLRDVRVEVMCDIDNPLCGERGAAAVFAPQKGADPAMVAKLDDGLAHMAQVVQEQMGKSVAELPGAGAAGGFGAGAVAFLNAVLRPGIEVVLDSVSFTQHLQNCDLVITGEGRIDGQSLGGKVPVGVARRAKGSGVPVIAIVGVTGEGYEAVYDEGITAVFTTNRAALPFHEIQHCGEADYRSVLEDVMRFAREIRAR